MAEWTHEARACLESYLAQVAALARRQGDDAEEIVSDLREHICRETEETAGALVTADALQKTLAAVGTPEQVAGVDSVAGLPPLEPGLTRPVRTEARIRAEASLDHSPYSLVPLQIWVVIALLGFEGIGNLLAIPSNPVSALWLGAKILFVTGLLLGWRWVFIFFLFEAAIHVVFFFAAAPVVSLINLALFVLVASAFRFYFPKRDAPTFDWARIRDK